ncbi:MAG TPA: hypothetical protein VN112_20570 [Ensifer sp.]|nr:hypothetical protein [Ensifer sp.]
MTQKTVTNDRNLKPGNANDQAPVGAAIEEASPPFNLPPLPKSRRAEMRVPASVNGRDLSQGRP